MNYFFSFGTDYCSTKLCYAGNSIVQHCSSAQIVLLMLGCCCIAGIRLIVWSGLALHRGHQFRLVCHTFRRRFFIFFNWQGLRASLQDCCRAYGPLTLESLFHAIQMVSKIVYMSCWFLHKIIALKTDIWICISFLMLYVPNPECLN